uniref:Uncharacterized protein n=1 Tax=Rhizophora mucronata TaxID=61149 RepID=A0A2P2Q2R6_RHIMU
MSSLIFLLIIQGKLLSGTCLPGLFSTSVQQHHFNPSFSSSPITAVN